MTIKQLNATYLVNEDRIFFRFNTQDQVEYRLWLTRRVTLFILVASTHLLTKKLEQVHSPDTAKAVNEFEKAALIEASKTANAGSTDYESGVQFPLGFDPLLVMDVSYSLTKNGEKVTDQDSSKAVDFDDALSIDFLLPGGGNLNLNLPNNLMRAMCLLLDQLRIQAGWGEAVLSIKKDVEIQSVVEEEPKKNSPLH
ncbi:hypothetical protein AOC19_03150 [Polynucleobacter asymbioticus]|uniref:hypothetical protein n=1 Tax=Polynucleobacter asymbioticus TaxID=576611 RepID=UPI001BFDCDF8|nr:hypothetical protein [Polynucleobacter asymbioticus]QWD85880.1 hypothetical protein AOC19_03150 [Polynucleobacter asymbioticus]